MRVVSVLVFLFVGLGILFLLLGSLELEVVCYLLAVIALFFYVRATPVPVSVVESVPVPSMPLSLPKVEPVVEPSSMLKAEQGFIDDDETEIVFGKKKEVR